MDSVRRNCVLCDRVLQRRSTDVWDEPLAETEDFLVVPSKGSIVPGWLLVVSKSHVLCTGALKHLRSESLNEALLVARRLVEPTFGPVTLFEHGPAEANTALGCGVDHLHIHAAPLRFSLRASFHHMFSGSSWSEARVWSDLREVHLGGTSYVAVQEPGSPLYWSLAPTGTRQPLRRAIAASQGVADQFDYNLYPHTSNILETVRSLSAA